MLVTPRGGEAERYDEVVLAAHSDQALRMLTDAIDREHEMLGRVPFQRNEAVLHTDVADAAAPAPGLGELELPPQSSPRPDRTTVTYHMNRLQSLRSERQFCVTLNRTDAIDPAKIIRRIDYAHPVFTAAGVRAQSRVAEISGQRHTHFCGAYWGWGFHEDGVASARRVAERFGDGAVTAAACTRGRSATGADRPARSSAIASRWPTSTSTSCRSCSAAGCCARGPACCASAAATTSATRRPRWSRRSAIACRSSPARRPTGPIRLLTQLRSWGVCFNPVSFYYCLDPAGEHVETVLAEVTNTPWGERQSYLLHAAPAGAVLRGRFAKALHVSPFMGMDHVYEARATEPGPTLSVQIDSLRDGEAVFDATLGMQRRALTARSGARHALRHPAAAARVLVLIYGHAVGLKLAGARVHAHPASGAAT